MRVTTGNRVRATARAALGFHDRTARQLKQSFFINHQSLPTTSAKNPPPPPSLPLVPPTELAQLGQNKTTSSCYFSLPYMSRSCTKHHHNDYIPYQFHITLGNAGFWVQNFFFYYCYGEEGWDGFLFFLSLHCINTAFTASL